MPEAQSRPHYAPENRSPNAGKFIAVAVFALLILGGMATLVVVLTRGSSGITPPAQKIPSAKDVVAPEATPETPSSATPAPAQ
ncbi:MAG: hypothetical protein QM516_03095 [Limnohabitans sp.]|nr:hypothetical protein [Limnohabitans sp.]